MFKFINEKGETFIGTSPYIHWIDGQLSTGLWYTLKLMLISDTETLHTSPLSQNSIFKFIDTQRLSDTNINLNDITVDNLTSTGQQAYIPNNIVVLEDNISSGSGSGDGDISVVIPSQTCKIIAAADNPVYSPVTLNLTGDFSNSITIQSDERKKELSTPIVFEDRASNIAISPRMDEKYIYKFNCETYSADKHNLPSLYQELEFIVSDSKAAFKVPYDPKSSPYPGFKIKMHCTPGEHTTNQRIFGVWADSGYTDYGLYVLPSNNIIYRYISNPPSSISIDMNYNYSGDFMQECYMINQSGKSFDGTDITMSNNSDRYDYAQYIGIGNAWDGKNNKFITTDNPSSTCIGYLALYKGDDLVYEFIPCKCKSNSKIGMYDTVNGVFYSSETDVEFTAPQINNITVSAAVAESYYIHQMYLVCSSDKAGEFIDQFEIEGNPIQVGVDLYNINETLPINLSNRGFEIPESVQKAFLKTDIEEDRIDNALINRKFKELISNYIDIIDNKGSYKSLYNSLDWFEWGDCIKLYEIWKNDNEFFEKTLSNILPDTYSSLLYSYSKTTHLALVAALQEITGALDEEKNPVLQDISYEWSTNELALKISILGAFFERYFMPIHLDLKRACVEAMIYTNQIKIESGTINDKSHFFDDYGPVDIDMNKTVTIGNIDAVAVGPDTMFGRYIDNMSPSSPVYYINPVGVDVLDNIGINTEQNNNINNENLARFYLQLAGGVGAIIPVNISVNIPNDDALCTEVITVIRDGDPESTLQVTEHRLIKPNDGKATFTFNLLSTKEETVEFSLMLTATSGHTWNAKTGYKCIDPYGSYLNIYQVENQQFNTMDEWLHNPVPYSAQFNPYTNPNTRSEKNVIQYIPYAENLDISLFNQLIVVENFTYQGEYDDSWITQADEENFWIIKRSGAYDVDGQPSTSPDAGTDANPRYVMLISKRTGKIFSNKSMAASVISGGRLQVSNVLRLDMVFIPQLHKYTDIESKPITLANYTYSNNDLLCVIPQFTRSVAQLIDTDSIFWEFTNKTTLETIKTYLPIQIPLIANNTNQSLLSPGYWTVTMYYKLNGSSELLKLTKNSAFKIQAQ